MAQLQVNKQKRTYKEEVELRKRYKEKYKNRELKTWTTEEVRYFYRQVGCCLLDEYNESSQPMNYICICGEPDIKSFNEFISGDRCNNCEKREYKNYHIK